MASTDHSVAAGRRRRLEFPLGLLIARAKRLSRQHPVLMRLPCSLWEAEPLLLRWPCTRLATGRWLPPTTSSSYE